MRKLEFSFMFACPWSDTNWQYLGLEEAYLDLWKCVPDAFGFRSMIVGPREYEIEFDWRNLLAFQLQEKNVRTVPALEAVATTGEEVSSRDRIVCCNVTIRNPQLEDHAEEGLASSVLCEVFKKLFLAMNLAMPGSCNVSLAEADAGAGIVRPKFDAIYFGYEWGRIWTSLNDEERPTLPREARTWPPVACLSLTDTVKWLDRFDWGTRQIANSRSERALFSLLNVSSENRISPTNLLWIAHALEALYHTPQVAVSESLRDRSFLALGRPVDSVVWKKRLKVFYELRSSFVHGRMDIAMPEANEILDEEIWGYNSKLLAATEQSLALAISTLQLLIKNDWESLQFESAMKGVPFT